MEVNFDRDIRQVFVEIELSTYEDWTGLKQQEKSRVESSDPEFEEMSQDDEGSKPQELINDGAATMDDSRGMMKGAIGEPLAVKLRDL